MGLCDSFETIFRTGDERLVSTLALFAASGKLPVVLAEEARRSGYELVAFGVTPSVGADLKDLASHYYEISPGQLQLAIDICKELGVFAVMFAGKFEKREFCSGMELDPRIQSVLSMAARLGDDSIMRALAAEFESEGFVVLSQIELGRSLLAREGVLTSRIPSDEEMKDVACGLDAIRVMGCLDVGQSVVVKRRVIVAVEGVEGTDQAILRGGTLSGGGAVVVKAPKPGQDLRFDVPTVGERTVLSMHVSGCSVLAVKSGSTFLLDPDRTVELADMYGISIVGV